MTSQSLHPQVKEILDQIPAHTNCPFCDVVSRINWKGMENIAKNQAAVCEHCRDAPDMISFLHDLVTVHKKGKQPFDKTNFVKWCRIAAMYLDSKKSDFTEHVHGLASCAHGSIRSKPMGQNHTMITCCNKKDFEHGSCDTAQQVIKIIHNHEGKHDTIFEEHLGKMAQAIVLTEKHKIEHGFCQDSKIVEGQEYSVTLPNCSKKLNFHTHVSGIMHPSDFDFITANIQHATAECVGTSEGVACFEPSTRHKIWHS